MVTGGGCGLVSRSTATLAARQPLNSGDEIQTPPQTATSSIAPRRVHLQHRNPLHHPPTPPPPSPAPPTSIHPRNNDITLYRASTLSPPHSIHHPSVHPLARSLALPLPLSPLPLHVPSPTRLSHPQQSNHIPQAAPPVFPSSIVSLRLLRLTLRH